MKKSIKDELDKHARIQFLKNYFWVPALILIVGGIFTFGAVNTLVGPIGTQNVIVVGMSLSNSQYKAPEKYATVKLNDGNITTVRVPDNINTPKGTILVLDVYEYKLTGGHAYKYSRIEPEYNKSLNLTGAKNAPPS